MCSIYPIDPLHLGINLQIKNNLKFYFNSNFLKQKCLKKFIEWEWLLTRNEMKHIIVQSYLSSIFHSKTHDKL
jgi:uncharacterized protein with von Willebrand factor type A (vWA) domain